MPGSWRAIDDHTVTFQPTDAGFTLGHTFSVELPKAATVTTKKGLAARSVLQWHVPDASQDRLEQLLAQFGYMPLTFVSKTKVPTDADAQLTAAVVPPAGALDVALEEHAEGAAVALDRPASRTRSTRARS